MGVKIIGESGLGFPVRDNSAIAIKKGEKRWNLKEGSTETGVFDNVNIVDGSDIFKLVRNNSGSTILKGKVVMASGTLGASGRIVGSLSDGTVTNAVRNLGITKHNIISGNDGVVIKDGKIDNMDTTGSSVGESWIDGTILYIKPNDSGALTSVVPTSGQLKMSVAFVIKAHASNGSIEVRMTGINENEFINKNGNQTIDAGLTFTVSPTVPTPTAGDNSAKVATTAYVDNKVSKDISYKNTPINITSWSYVTTTITLNVASHTFVAGDYIEVNGLTSTTYPANGIHLVTSVTSTTIVFTLSATPTGTTGVSSATVKGYATINGRVSESIGVGQTWQDVTASKVTGTTYTNTTGKPIGVVYSFATTDTTPRGITINGVLISRSSNTAGNIEHSITVVIPNGATYIYSTTLFPTLEKRYELR